MVLFSSFFGRVFCLKIGELFSPQPFPTERPELFLLSCRGTGRGWDPVDWQLAVTLCLSLPNAGLEIGGHLEPFKSVSLTGLFGIRDSLLRPELIECIPLSDSLVL